MLEINDIVHFTSSEILAFYTKASMCDSRLSKFRNITNYRLFVLKVLVHQPICMRRMREIACQLDEFSEEIFSTGNCVTIVGVVNASRSKHHQTLLWVYDNALDVAEIGLDLLRHSFEHVADHVAHHVRWPNIRVASLCSGWRVHRLKLFFSLMLSITFVWVMLSITFVWVGLQFKRHCKNTTQIVVMSHDISKGKGSFYIAQYPVHWTAQSALHFLPSPGRPVHSDTNSASPGSILARQQLRAKAKSLTFPPLSIARYAFIQLSQQGCQWKERKFPIFDTVAKQYSNPGSLDCESDILPLSYRAPQ